MSDKTSQEFEYSSEAASLSIALYKYNQRLDIYNNDQDNDVISDDDVFEPIEPDGFDDLERINNYNEREIVTFELRAFLVDVSVHFICINKLCQILQWCLFIFFLKSEAVQIDVNVVLHESLHQKYIFRSICIEPHGDDLIILSDEEFEEVTTKVSNIIVHLD